jgi:hypothetical protein
LNSGGGNSNVSIHDSVIDHWGYGIRAGTTAPNVRNIVIHNNYFEDNLQEDVNLGSDHLVIAVTITNNYFYASAHKPRNAVVANYTLGLVGRNNISLGHTDATWRIRDHSKDFLLENTWSTDEKLIQVDNGSVGRYMNADGQMVTVTTMQTQATVDGGSSSKRTSEPRPEKTSRENQPAAGGDEPRVRR